MKVTFQKLPGDPALGVAFYWSLTLRTRTPGTLSERLIPELFEAVDIRAIDIAVAIFVVSFVLRHFGGFGRFGRFFGWRFFDLGCLSGAHHDVDRRLGN